MAGKPFYILTTPGVKHANLVSPMLDHNTAMLTDGEQFKGFVEELSKAAGVSLPPYQQGTEFVEATLGILKAEHGEEFIQNEKYFFEGIHHINLPVRDINDSIRFYRDFLLLKEIVRPFTFEGAWFGLPSGQHIHLVEDKNLPDRSDFRKKENINPKGCHFALRVEYSRWKAIMDELDFKDLIPDSPEEAVKINQIYIFDPDCHVIEINALTPEQLMLKVRENRQLP